MNMENGQCAYTVQTHHWEWAQDHVHIVGEYLAKEEIMGSCSWTMSRWHRIRNNNVEAHVLPPPPHDVVGTSICSKNGFE